MAIKVGDKMWLPIRDDWQLEGIVDSVYADDDYEYATFIIPEMHNYKTGEYFFPKRIMNVEAIADRANMPLDYSGKGMEAFDWRFYKDAGAEMKATVETFLFRLDDFLKQSMGLYIHSKTKGSGKTMLACCIGNEIIKRRGLSVKFVDIQDFIQAYRDKVADEFLNASVLIVDDLGIQDDKKEWIASIVYALVNRRYNRQKLTIFTSNKPFAECSSEDRVISRVERMAIEVAVPEIPVRSIQAKILKDSMSKSIMEAE